MIASVIVIPRLALVLVEIFAAQLSTHSLHTAYNILYTFDTPYTYPIHTLCTPYTHPTLTLCTLYPHSGHTLHSPCTYSTHNLHTPCTQSALTLYTHTPPPSTCFHNPHTACTCVSALHTSCAHPACECVCPAHTPYTHPAHPAHVCSPTLDTCTVHRLQNKHN